MSDNIQSLDAVAQHDKDRILGNNMKLTTFPSMYKDMDKSCVPDESPSTLPLREAINKPEPRTVNEIAYEELRGIQSTNAYIIAVDDVFISALDHASRELDGVALYTMYRIVRVDEDRVVGSYAYRKVGRHTYSLITRMKHEVPGNEWKKIGTWDGEKVNLLGEVQEDGN